MLKVLFSLCFLSINLQFRSPTIFTMEPAFYQDAHNVDWGELAQQWIRMKESLPPDQQHTLPEAPPPPSIGISSSYRNDYFNEEKGEAPMEVVKDDDMYHFNEHNPQNYTDLSRRYQTSDISCSVTVKNRNRFNNFSENKSVPSQNQVLGSAKRKMLPAWIREGNLSKSHLTVKCSNLKKKNELFLRSRKNGERKTKVNTGKFGKGKRITFKRL